MGGALLHNRQTHDPHSLAKKYNEAIAADGCSSGLGIWRRIWWRGRTRILSMFFSVMMAAITQDIQTILQAGSSGI
jgi:hypothetical protein